MAITATLTGSAPQGGFSFDLLKDGEPYGTIVVFDDDPTAAQASADQQAANIEAFQAAVSG